MQLAELQAEPLEPGPGNSRGGLVRDTGESERFKVDRSTFAQPKDAGDAKAKAKLQQEYAKAIEDGRSWTGVKPDSRRWQSS